MEPQGKRAKMVPPPPPNMTLKKLSICRDCNLVFLNARALRCHNETEHHKLATDGLRPPQGNFFCFLCWQGFRHMDDLRTHYNRETHEENTKSHGVKAIWMSRNSDFIETIEEHCYKSTSTSPLSLSSIEDEETEDLPATPKPNQCMPCNLVFSSAIFLQRHLTTKTHETVLSKVVDKSSFSCLLCCQAFQIKEEFRMHIESNLHKSFMRSNGVIGYVEDIMTASKVNDYVVVDDVGDEDVLEEISSDDDEEDVDSPIKPADLEEVSSPEHDFNDDDDQEATEPEQVALPNVTHVVNNDKELEDIHSEEEEVSLSESEPEVELPDLPIPIAPSKSNQKITCQDFEEIHSEEEIDDTAPDIENVDQREERIEVSKPVMNNQDALESVSSPESKSTESDVDLAFVERVELIYD